MRISLLPVLAAAASIATALTYLGIGAELLTDPELVLVVSLLMLASLTPYAIEEYMRYRRQLYVESMLPSILAVIESRISAGEPPARAVADAVSLRLQRYSRMIKAMVAAGYPVSHAVRMAAGAGSPLVSAFTSYIDALIYSGSSALDTLPRVRYYISKIVDMRLRISSYAFSAFLVSLLMYVAVAASIYIAISIVPTLPIDRVYAGMIQSYIASLSMVFTAISAVSMALIFGRISSYMANRFMIYTVTIAIAVEYALYHIYRVASSQ